MTCLRREGLNKQGFLMCGETYLCVANDSYQIVTIASDSFQIVTIASDSYQVHVFEPLCPNEPQPNVNCTQRTNCKVCRPTATTAPS